MKNLRVFKETPFYLLVCVALLPMFVLRDFTPANELRYLSIADEALRNHVFFAFTNHGAIYADKPPLYFWIVMLCKWLTGEHRMWLLSLFSLLPALGTLRIMDRWTAQELSDESRKVARMMLLACGLFLVAALILRMDMLMCFFIVCALRQFWKMYTGEDGSGRAKWLFPVYVFLAMFTKGALGLLVPLVGTAIFLLASKQIKLFFRFWSWRTWVVLIAGCLLWFGGVYAEGGSEYLQNMLVHQTVGRAVNSFRHAEPFWYYAAIFWYSFMPWSLLIAGALIVILHPRFVWSDMQRLFLSVALSTFLMLSCISSKLQIYLLPAVPFFIYSVALSLPNFQKTRWQRICLAVPAFIFAVAAPALIIVVALREDLAYLGEVTIYLAAIVLSLSGIYSLVTLYKNKDGESVSTTVHHLGGGMLLAIFLFGWAMPRINAESSYGILCNKTLEVSQERDITDIRTWNMRRAENMDVYLHRPVETLRSEVPPASDKEHPYILLIRKRDLGHFPDQETIVVGAYAIVIRS